MREAAEPGEVCVILQCFCSDIPFFSNVLVLLSSWGYVGGLVDDQRLVDEEDCIDLYLSESERKV